MISGILSSVSSRIRIDGGTDSIAIGPDAGTLFDSDDTDNIAIGRNALNSTTTAAQNNIAIGTGALTSLTTGDGNIAIGYKAQNNITTGATNSSFGYKALDTATTATQNVAMGYNAMSAIPAAVALTGCVAIGHSAMVGGASTTAGAAYNVAVGHSSQIAITTGGNNVSVGNATLESVTSGANNTAIGESALPDVATTDFNTAIGSYAGRVLTGSGNTAIGSSTAYNAVDVDDLVGIGYAALYQANHVAADRSVAIGRGAAYSLAPASGSASACAITAVGYHSARYLGVAGAGNKGITSIGYLAHGGGHTTATNNTALYNTAVGWKAFGGETGTSTAITADQGVAVGYGALKLISTGNDNVAVGHKAGDALTTGGKNIAIGTNSMGAAQDVDDCVVVGYGALLVANEDDADATIAIGANALEAYAPTGGSARTSAAVAIGYNAGRYLGGAVARVGNTMVGYGAMSGGESDALADNTASYCTAFGRNTLGGNSSGTDDTDAVTSLGSTCVGYHAGGTLTTGNYNTLIGYGAADTITTGAYNVALGAGALGSITTGSGNIAIGLNALDAADAGEDYNIAIGHEAMSTANDNNYDYNIAIGFQALMGGTEADGQVNCIAIGSNTLDAAANTCENTIAIGKGAMGTGTVTADENIAIGTLALEDITSGVNIGIGYNAGLQLTTGTENIAIGYEALDAAVDDDYNIAIGTSALTSLTGINGAGHNVSVGYGSGLNLDNGTDNVFLGNYAGQGTDGSNNATGNTFVGKSSGNAIGTDGNYNAGLGNSALVAVTSGDYNVGVGYAAGDTISTGGYNTFIGYASDGTAAQHGQTGLGYSAKPTYNYETRVGYHGGFQFYSRTVECTFGGTATGDPGHADPIGKIPQYSVIKSVTATVIELSDSNNALYNIVLASESTGVDNQALSNMIEILGAGTGSNTTYSSAGDSAAMDIKADDGTDGAIIKSSYANTDLSGIDLNDRDYYIYVAFADGNHEGGDTNPSDPPKIRVCVEYAGQD